MAARVLGHLARTRAALFGAACVVACVASPALAQQAEPTQTPEFDTKTDVNDPFEGFNRTMFGINLAVDRYTLRPAARAYRAVVPSPLRDAVTNAVKNAQEPMTMGNALLQFKPDTFFNSLGRFLINSTVGIGGFFDWASKWGVARREEDFGQTLAVWGVPEGPYLMLPFFGASNPRDAMGIAADIVADPIEFVFPPLDEFWATWIRRGVRVGDTRTRALSTFDVLLSTSADPYVAVRSAYRQVRIGEIYDGNPPAPKEDEFE
jgi:phospholipid-binding lipoprotein MlaA